MFLGVRAPAPTLERGSITGAASGRGIMWMAESRRIRSRGASCARGAIAFDFARDFVIWLINSARFALTIACLKFVREPDG
jgi:hypothetical protein